MIRRFSTAIGVVVLGLLAPRLANASDIDIPPQSLGLSLQQLAKQAGIQIVTFARVVDGKNAQGLHGDYTPEAALAALLDGTDLTYRLLNDRAFEIVPRPTSAVPPANRPAPVAVIDEVAITAQLEKLSKMREQIQKIEDEFFARYNELNTNPAYDVTCRTEARTGRHVMTRTCVPAFALQLDKFKDGRIRFQNADLPVTVPLTAQTPDYQKNMVELVKQHPELFKLLEERDTLARRYEATRKRKLAGKFYVWD